MNSKKIPGLTWTGKAWRLRARAMSGSLTIEREKTIPGRQDLPPVAALAELKAEARAELERTLVAGSGPETLTAFAPLWLKRQLAKGRTHAYVENRTRWLERFILPRFGHLTIKQITPKAVDAWKDWLADQRTEDGQPYAHATLLTAWETARTFTRWVAVQNNVSAPMRDVVFDLKGKAARQKDTLTADELGRLFSHLRVVSPDVATLVVLGFALGLRFSELSALHWSDINLAEGVLRLQRSHVLGNVGDTKTMSTKRTVHLTSALVDLLLQHKATQGSETAIVFPSRNGTYRRPHMLRKPLAALCAAAGIRKHITAHCMRHTCNTLLLEVTSEAVVRKMIGHSTTSMTFQYAHAEREAQLRARERAFGEAIGGAVSPAARQLPTA